MGFGITSEAQLIDIAQIERGCQQIEDAAQAYSQAASRISSVSCGSDVLAVNGGTVQPSIDGLGSRIGALEGEASAFTADIRAQAQEIYQRQKAELEAYKRHQEELAKAQAAANNK